MEPRNTRYLGKYLHILFQKFLKILPSMNF